MQNQTVFKIRIRRPEILLDTPAGTRRYTVHGEVLTFGREPVYLQASQLPPELANDAYLDVEPVEAAPPGTEVLHLKAERIEQPANDNTGPGEESRLKAERIEQPAANDNDSGEESRLKAERIEQPSAAAASTRANSKRP